ncbi:MAG: hypothetical protein ACYTKD_10650 [Planctomycetota bacterium]|jgi:hypothetical protein
MKFWDKYRKLLSGIGIAFLGVLAFHILLVSRFTSAKEKLRAQLEDDVQKEIKPRRKGVFEVVKAAEEFRQSNADLARRVEALMQRVEIPFHSGIVNIPPDYAHGTGPGAWFLLKHSEQCRDLNVDCIKASPRVSLLDQDLGFTEILKANVDPEGAQENLNRLSLVTRVVKLLVEAGVAEVVKITHDEPGRAGAEGYADIMLEYSVQIDVRTRLDPLMKFLHKVRQPGKFFLVVRGLEIDGQDPYGKRASRNGEADERMLSVTITSAGMRFLTPEERKAAQEAARPVATGPVKVYDRPLGH